MIKKCLIAIAVVALLATTVQAASPAIKKEGTWPWTKIYDEFPICTFPVTLEVGHFVQILDCDKLVMKLEQVNCSAIGQAADKFPCYGDIDEALDLHGPACVTIQARANFPAIFGATFAGGGTNIIGGHSLTWPSGNTIVGGTSWESLKLCMTAWSVALWNTGGQTSGTVTVGTITINVKPQNEYGP